jgi:hypothetical protein
MIPAVAPRVRTLVICDAIRTSRAEENVFHLRGVRSQVSAEGFPFRRRLRLFLVLSSPRPDRFPSHVKIIDDATDQAVFYGQVDPAAVFPEAEGLLTLDLPVRVRLPNAGRYTVQVWFFQVTGADVLKMEQPIHIVQCEG